MNKHEINQFRQHSRKLIRELGILQLNVTRTKKKPQHWHALIDIARSTSLTISELSHLLLLSLSATSRIVTALHKDNLIVISDGNDKREKYLTLTEKGKSEIEYMDEYSNIKIRGAFNLLSEEEQINIMDSIKKYGEALEQSRLLREETAILTLPPSCVIRKKIISMIETIQKDEYSIPITKKINECILKAEETFYYDDSYHFWYAMAKSNEIIGCIGLKKIDNNNAEIKKFFINKKYRGKGIAQKLMYTLVKDAINQRFQYLYLGTVNILHAAQRFYNKCGFTPIEMNSLPDHFDICPLDTVFFQGKVAKIYPRLMQTFQGMGCTTSG